jgi:hypothetical protein
MKDIRFSVEARKSQTVEEAASMGRAKQACRPDWECIGCGVGVNGAHAPVRCGKCGGFKFAPVRPIFEDIASVIGRIQDAAREGAGAVVARGHRKSRFIAAQFRLAEEAMERARRAIFVEGGK